MEYLEKYKYKDFLKVYNPVIKHLESEILIGILSISLIRLGTF